MEPSIWSFGPVVVDSAATSSIPAYDHNSFMSSFSPVSDYRYDSTDSYSSRSPAGGTVGCSDEIITSPSSDTYLGPDTWARDEAAELLGSPLSYPEPSPAYSPSNPTRYCSVLSCPRIVEAKADPTRRRPLGLHPTATPFRSSNASGRAALKRHLLAAPTSTDITKWCTFPTT